MLCFTGKPQEKARELFLGSAGEVKRGVGGGYSHSPMPQLSRSPCFSLGNKDDEDQSGAAAVLETGCLLPGAMRALPDCVSIAGSCGSRTETEKAEAEG